MVIMAAAVMISAAIPHAHAEDFYCVGKHCGTQTFSCTGPDCSWMSSGTFQESATTYFSKWDTNASLSYDGTKVTLSDPDKTEPLKLVMYLSNQPYWGQQWQTIAPPQVLNVSDGSTMNAPCGHFQADVIPRGHVVYQNPTYTGDRYGFPGDNVLVTAVNGTRVCSQPTATPPPTEPTAPTNITIVEGDSNGGAIIQTRSVRVTWSYPDGGSGCGTAWNSTCPGTTNTFNVSFSGASTSAGGDVSRTTRAYTSAPNLKANGNYTVRVCANNGSQEKCSTALFTKVPYPTGFLSGDLAERAPNAAPIACVNGVRGIKARPDLTPTGNGITTTCSVSPSGIATRYSCSVTLDNVNYDPDVSPDFTISSEANQLYSNTVCGSSCTSNGACTTVYRPNFDANNSPNTIGSQNIYFNLNSNTSYYRIKNSSYYDRNNVSSLFPVNDQSFDADDLPADGHFSRGETPTNVTGVGLVMSNGTQTVGESGATYSGISPRGWSSDTYTEASSDVSQRLIDYVKNRAEHTSIARLSDTKFQNSSYGTFVIDGDVTITAANAPSFNNKNVFIAVTGKLTIEANFIPTNAGTAFVANSVFIKGTVSEVRALITANNISLLGEGETGPSAIPLKIVGTISSGSPVNTNNRSRSDAFKPSLFIVSNPDIYTRLLPMITIIRYDWQQLQ